MSKEYSISEDPTFARNFSLVFKESDFESLPPNINPSGTTSFAKRIRPTSAHYPGAIFKQLLPHKIRSIFARNFKLNATALDRLNWYPLALGRVPKLLAKGNYNGIPAVIESTMPGVNPEIEKLSAADRIRFYRSLSLLYLQLGLFGIVHTGPQKFDLALLPNSKAGLIDFGGAYVEGSSLNNSTKQEAEKHTVENFKLWTQLVEQEAPDHIHGIRNLVTNPFSDFASLFISTLKLHT